MLAKNNYKKLTVPEVAAIEARERRRRCKRMDCKICPIMSRPVYNGKFLELYVVHCYGAQCKLYSTCDKSTGPVAIKNVTPVPGL